MLLVVDDNVVVVDDDDDVDVDVDVDHLSSRPDRVIRLHSHQIGGVVVPTANLQHGFGGLDDSLCTALCVQDSIAQEACSKFSSKKSHRS